jgi:hypothetical protein
LIKKIEENVLLTYRSVLTYVSKFYYTSEFVESFEFKNVCTLISNVTCHFEPIMKLSNASAISSVADQILNIFKQNANAIKKNLIYGEHLFNAIIKVSSNPAQINPLDAIPNHYTIQRYGVQWDIKIFAREIEVSNNKNIRCSINKDNILFINLSANADSTFNLYFVFKLSDNSFAVFENTNAYEHYVNDITAWAIKNDVQISRNNWSGRNAIQGGYNG